VKRHLRLFLVLLLVLLAYTLLERHLRAGPGPVPAFFDWGGILLAVGSLPWSLTALGFFRATASPLAHVARDVLYLLIFTAGTALNAVLLISAVKWIMRRVRGD
jgi:cytochrome c biogenesis protein CcdA